VILLEGSIEIEPTQLLHQLKDGGRLLAVQGGGSAAKAVAYRATRQQTSSRPIFDATAALLPGFAEPAVFVF
jgi:protein-L-isoaspartate(D-aspartate) O-methyltransferase